MEHVLVFVIFFKGLTCFKQQKNSQQKLEVWKICDRDLLTACFDAVIEESWETAKSCPKLL